VKRLLYIAHRVPFPPNKGERVRAFHELKTLAQDFRITLAALVHSKEDYEAAGFLRQWCKRIILAPAGGKTGLIRGGWSLVQGKSVTEGFFHSRSLYKQLEKETRRKPFDIALAYSSSMLGYLLRVPVPYRLMDLVDVDSAKWFAYAKESGWPMNRLYQREGQAVRRLEQDAVARCDAVMLVSGAESEALGSYSKKVSVLSNGVDTEYFMPRKSTRSDGVSLVFTGTMDYRPNVEGVCWFVKQVWPDLRRQMPELAFYIVGRNPTRAVKQLAAVPGVSVTGKVPDVRPYLAEARVAVCPLFLARGIQNKVLEAMAMGRAVIASGPALEGLEEVKVGKDVLQADSPDEWKSAILQLLGAQNRRLELEQQARQCVETKYSWAARMSPLTALCHQFVDRQPEPQQIPITSAPAKEITDSALLGEMRPAINKRLAAALWLMTLAYLGVILSTSVMPSGKRLPVIGVWDADLSPMVQNMLHMPAYAMLMICVSLAMTASMRFRAGAIILSVVMSFLIGVFMEYLQGFVPGRTVSTGDIFLNSTGIMLALPAAMSWRWRHTSFDVKLGRKTKNRHKA